MDILDGVINSLIIQYLFFIEILENFLGATNKSYHKMIFRKLYFKNVSNLFKSFYNRSKTEIFQIFKYLLNLILIFIRAKINFYSIKLLTCNSKIRREKLKFCQQSCGITEVICIFFFFFFECIISEFPCKIRQVSVLFG